MSGVVAYLNRLIEKANSMAPGPYLARKKTGIVAAPAGDGSDFPLFSSAAPHTRDYFAALDPQVVAALARIALAVVNGQTLQRYWGLEEAVTELSRVVDQQSRT